MTDCGRYLILTPREGCDPVNRLYYVDLQTLKDGISGKAVAALARQPFAWEHLRYGLLELVFKNCVLYIQEGKSVSRLAWRRGKLRQTEKGGGWGGGESDNLIGNELKWKG